MGLFYMGAQGRIIKINSVDTGISCVLNLVELRF